MNNNTLPTTAEAEAMSNTNEPRRSSRTPKPKTFDSEDFAPPVQRRRTETGEEAKKQSPEELREKRKAKEDKRAQVNAEKLARKREKERLDLEKQQLRLQKQEEKLKREKAKTELKAQRERDRQFKKLEQEKLKEQKKAAKELKQKPKAAVHMVSLTKYMEQHGITSTSSPEDFSKVLEVARNYHAMRNGNSVTVSTSNRPKLSDAQLATFKDLYTQPTKSLVAPDVVHSAPTTTATPLPLDKAVQRAQEALVVASVMFDSDSEAMEEDLTGEDFDEGTNPTVDNQDADSVELEPNVPLTIEIPELPSLDDEEAAQLHREQKELEGLIAIAKEKAKLRKRNKELQEQLQCLLKEEDK